MEMRYDGYYEKEIPYKMTMEELVAKEYMSEEDILAYMRYVGPKNLLILAKTHPLKNMNAVGGFFSGELFVLCSGEKVSTICRIVEDNDSSLNPFIDDDGIVHKDHWYSPYKIRFTSIEFHGIIENMYVTDFCSLVKDGRITLIEYEEFNNVNE